jgi:hypothetical protein
LKILLNVLFQDRDVQSRLVDARRSIRGTGIRDGRGDACGLCKKKYARLSLDNASASTLSTPGKWTAETMILNFAVTKCRQRRRANAWASELVPELIISTSASL